MDEKPVIQLYKAENGYIVEVAIFIKNTTVSVGGMQMMSNSEPTRRTFVATTIEEALDIIKEQSIGFVIPDVFRGALDE